METSLKTIKRITFITLLFCGLMINKTFALNVPRNVPSAEKYVERFKNGNAYELGSGTLRSDMRVVCLNEDLAEPSYTKKYYIDSKADFGADTDLSYILCAALDSAWADIPTNAPTLRLYYNPVQGALWKALGYNITLTNGGTINGKGIGSEVSGANGKTLYSAAQDYEAYRSKLAKFDKAKVEAKITVKEQGNELIIGNVDYSIATLISYSGSATVTMNGNLSDAPTVHEELGELKKVIITDKDGKEKTITNKKTAGIQYRETGTTSPLTDFPQISWNAFDLIIDTSVLGIQPKNIKFVFEDTAYKGGILKLITSDVIHHDARSGTTSGETGVTFTRTITDKDGTVHTVTECGGRQYFHDAYDEEIQSIGIIDGEPEDTDRIIEVELEDDVPLDLSLRKFITKIDGKEVNSREPQVDTTPLKNKTGTTAIYNHPKDTLEVHLNNEIVYTIRVYNEGEVDSYATEIKDHLPSNLEFVSSIVDGVDYKWTVSADGRTLTTDYLKDTKLSKYNNGNSLDYKDVKVILKVKKETKDGETLVNIADISKYAYDDNGTKTDISKDIDSRSNNVVLPSDSDWPKYIGKSGNPKGNYWEGQEDDDDFERVNVQHIIDIGGTVWLDGVEGKQDERDGKLTELDQRLEGIRVLLYEVIDGKGTLIEETKTDSKGNYIFKDKQASKKYVVRFEYKGQEYIPVQVTKLDSGKYTSQDSAGEERQSERDALNNLFYEIVKGTAKNRNGENTVALRYSKDTTAHKSTLIRDDDFNSKTKIKANTVEFNGSEAYVGYINLGLVERAQIDLRLASNVKSVEMSINGVTETYTRDSEGTPFADVDEISLKYDKTLPDVVYNMAIYHSDYTYRIDDYKDTEAGTPDNAQPLKVYVTYVIKVENTSSKNGKVSELKVWYPEEYNMNKSWYARSKTATDGNGTSWNETGRTAGQNLKGDSVQYKVATTDSIKNETVSPNEPIYIFIRFEVGTNADGSIRLGNRNVLSEITGYTTEEGLIDINSEPGNFEVTTSKTINDTYEDDTAVAISLDLQAPEDLKRTMTGYVWEDLATDTDADGVKIGNGIFEGGETKQDGVTVQLIELAEKDGTVYEYIWQETTTGSNKVSYMDRNGNVKNGANARTVTAEKGSYTFTDYIPGKYIVRFIYGETIKDNIVILSGQDYKSTTYTGYGENTSSAKDNKNRRLDVMNYPGEQTPETVKILANTGESEENAKTLRDNTWMNADTVDAMSISLTSTDPGHKVNFGLVERPKAILKVSTEIEGLKITNKGVILVDTAQGIETGLRKIDNKWTVELDDELINGANFEAKYKVKVINVGEKDTLYNYFEGDNLGGKVAATGDEQKTSVKSSSPLVYARNGGAEEQEHWIKVDDNTLSTTELNKLIAQNENTDELEIKTSRVLTIGSNMELDTKNAAEIINRYNQVGRRVEVEEGKTEDGVITITDPAGKPRVQYEIWIATLAIFVTGTVLVKKFVVKKKD